MQKTRIREITTIISKKLLLAKAFSLALLSANFFLQQEKLTRRRLMAIFTSAQ